MNQRRMVMPKAKSIYIFGEPQSGKSVVLLGIMELLSRHVQKLGFFRPLVREGEMKDDAIRQEDKRATVRTIKIVSPKTNIVFDIPCLPGERPGNNIHLR
jgi:BioD-like phosphotransacetylase family protein